MKKKKYKLPYKVNIMDILPFEEIYSWQRDKFHIDIPRLENGEMEFEIATEKQRVKYAALDITDVLGDLLDAVSRILHGPEKDDGGGYRASDYIAQVIHDTENGIFLWTFVYSENLLQVAIWKTWNVDFLEEMADYHFDAAKYESVKQKPVKDITQGLKFSVAMRPDYFVLPLLNAANRLKQSYSAHDFENHCAFPFPEEQYAHLKHWLDVEWQPE